MCPLGLGDLTLQCLATSRWQRGSRQLQRPAASHRAITWRLPNASPSPRMGASRGTPPPPTPPRRRRVQRSFVERRRACVEAGDGRAADGQERHRLFVIVAVQDLRDGSSLVGDVPVRVAAHLCASAPNCSSTPAAHGPWVRRRGHPSRRATGTVGLRPLRARRLPPLRPDAVGGRGRRPPQRHFLIVSRNCYRCGFNGWFDEDDESSVRRLMRRTYAVAN